MFIALGLMSNLSLGGMILVSLGNPFLVFTPFSLLGITSMEISKVLSIKKLTVGILTVLLLIFLLY